MRQRIFALTAGFVLFAPTFAFAAPDDNAAKADQLFKDGTAALEERRFDVACPKLAESHKIDPKALGTLVNLARCHEEWGKTATAYEEYTELEQGATAKKQTERITLAKKHKATLETKLSHIVFKIQRPVAGEMLKFDDGAPVDAASITVPQTFDPGDHAIEASAPGKTTYTSKFTVTTGPSTSDVIVPPLADPSAAPVATTATASPPPAETSTKWSTQKKVGAIGVGVGAAGLIVGGIFGLVAINGKSKVDSDCGSSATSCTTSKLGAANADYSPAHTAATVSTIGFIAGGVVAAAGVVLFLTAPTGSVEVAPAVGVNSGGVTLGGSF